MSIFDRALKIDSQLIDAYINRGNTYARLQEYDLALADYNQVLALNPQNLERYLGVTEQQKQNAISALDF